MKGKDWVEYEQDLEDGRLYILDKRNSERRMLAFWDKGSREFKRPEFMSPIDPIDVKRAMPLDAWKSTNGFYVETKERKNEWVLYLSDIDGYRRMKEGYILFVDGEISIFPCRGIMQPIPNEARVLAYCAGNPTLSHYPKIPDEIYDKLWEGV